ncbi:hypothetical protein ACFWUZ_12050 [Streptomyces sp. NPDC058646]|uniref:hypothetical protein n=1 Tax=Streptomyces sp. NPDC058646 TaxID=3346574 RepID=UPI00365A450F
MMRQHAYLVAVKAVLRTSAEKTRSPKDAREKASTTARQAKKPPVATKRPRTAP